MNILIGIVISDFSLNGTTFFYLFGPDNYVFLYFHNWYVS